MSRRGLLLTFWIILGFSVSGRSQTFSLKDDTNLPQWSSVDVATGDLNSDGYHDVIVSGRNSSGFAQSKVFLNNGDKTFVDITSGTLAQVYGGGIAIADLNNDGALDFVLTGTKDDGNPFSAYYLSSGTAFPTFSEHILTALSEGQLVVEDLDRDGRSDILLTGNNAASERKTLLYQNTSSGFSLQATVLPDVSEGEITAMDFDRDGYSDLLLTGFNSLNAKITKLFKNNKNFVFEEISTSLPAVASGSVASFDYNLDGYPDLLLNGKDAGNNPILKLYWNNAGGSFIENGLSLPPMTLSSFSTGDVTNDGYPDFLVTGYDSDTGDYLAKVYQNSGGTTFTSPATGLQGIINGQGIIADFNSDQKADVLLLGISSTGEIAHLNTNTIASANTNPNAPASLSSTPWSDGTVAMSWATASDTETSGSGLTYNVYVGSAPLQEDVLAASSDLSTGFLKRNYRGNAGYETELALNELPAGQYFWSVQTLDAAKGNSPFATEASFYICEQADAGYDVEICQGDEVTLNGTMPSGTAFTWYEEGNPTALVTNQASLVVSPSFTTNYIVEATHSSWGCISRDTVQVVVKESLDGTINAVSEVCYNTEWSASVTADVSDFTAEWYVAGSPSVLISSQKTVNRVMTVSEDIVLVTTHFVTGCQDFDTLTVNIAPLPSIYLGMETTSICIGDRLSLDAGPGWSDVKWYTELTGLIQDGGQTIDYALEQSDGVIVEVTDSKGCVNRDTIQVTVNPLPVFNLGSSRSVCEGDEVTIDAGTGWKQVDWYDESDNLLLSNSATYTFIASASHQLKAVVTNDNDCQKSASLQVLVDPLPHPDLGPDQTVCAGERVELFTSASWSTIKWYLISEGSTVQSNVNTFAFDLNQTEQVVLEVSNDKGCVNSDTLTLTKLDLPTVVLDDSLAICEGESFTLDIGTGWKDIQWYQQSSAGVLRGSESVYSQVVTEDDLVIVAFTDANDCVNRDTVIIHKLDLPAINLGNDRAICDGEMAIFNAGSAWNSVKWYTASGGTTPVSTDTAYSFTVTADETVIVEVTNANNCVNYDTLQAFKVDLPIIDLGEDQSVCDGETAIIDAGSAWNSVKWYTASGGTTPVSTDTAYSFTVTADETVIVEVTSANNCVNYDTLQVQKLELPVIDLGEDQSVCAGEPVTVNAGSGWNSVKWYTVSGGTTRVSTDTAYSFTVSADETVIVEVTNANNCVNYDTLQVLKLDLPIIDLGEDQSICLGEPAILNAGNEWTSVNWYTASGGASPVSSDTAYSFTVTADETIIVEVFNTNLCVNYDTLRITKLDLPAFDIGEDQALCEGERILLKTGTGWETVNWYSTRQGLLAADSWYYQHTVQETDTLIAEVYNEVYCVQYDTLIVQRNHIPVVDLGADQSICYGEEATIYAGHPDKTVNWYSSFNGLLAADQDTLILPVFYDETVWAEVISPEGCTGYDTVQVFLDALPEFALGADTAICYQESITLTPGTGWQTVNWYDESANLLASQEELTVQVTEPNTYVVEVYNTDGCVHYDTIFVDRLFLPEFSLPADTLICYGDIFEVTAGKEGEQTNWYIADTLRLENNAFYSQAITESIEVVAEVINASGCVYYDTMQVTMSPLPEVDAGEDRLICLGHTTQLGAEDLPDQGVLFEWSPAIGLDNPALARPIAKPDTTTLYTVKVTTASGCSAIDSVWVQVNPENVINPGEDVAICIGESTTLGGEPTAKGSVFEYQYSWFPAESLDDPSLANPIASPDTTTTYTLVVTTGNCFADTVQVTVRVDPLPVVTSSGDVTISAGQEIQLQAFGAATYEWYPSYGLDNASSDAPFASPVTTTTYVVNGYSDKGCMSSDTLTVFVNNQLFIPNLFTPNNDGQNDYFKLYGAGIKEVRLQVFTRTGQLIYESEDYYELMETGWDGTFNGSPMPSGNYIWTVQGTYYDGKPVLFEGKRNGSITLMR